MNKNHSILPLFALLCPPGIASDTAIDKASKSDFIAEDWVVKSNTLLKDVIQLAAHSAQIKRQFKQSPDTDLVLFISLVSRIENNLREKLDELIAIQRQLDKQNADAKGLTQALVPIIREQSRVLQEEIQGLMRLVGKIRKQDTKEQSLRFAINRAELGIDKLITQWQINRERGLSLKLDMSQDTRRLARLVQMRAIGLAGRI